MALPARPVWSCATSTSALGARRKRCRLLRDSRSVAKTRCSSAASASRSPRSALRTQTAGSGAWARVEDIVTSKGGPLIPASIAASPRRRIVRGALNPFAAGRDQRKNGGKRAATEQGKVPLCCNDAASSRRDPHRFNQGLTSTKAKSLPPKPYRCNQGTPPRPEKKPVAIGASAPIHPRVGQSGPPGFHPGGLAFARRQEGRMSGARGAAARARWRGGEGGVEDRAARP